MKSHCPGEPWQSNGCSGVATTREFAAFGRCLDARERRVHALDKLTLETGHAAEERVYHEVGYRFGAVLGVAALDHAGALLGRLQLVAPDQAVDIDPERHLLLRDHFSDRARGWPELKFAAVDVDRPGAWPQRAAHLHHSALWAPLRHAAEISDQGPHPGHRSVDIDLRLQ